MTPASDQSILLLTCYDIQEALAWMINRENSGALPPFWEATGGRASSILYKNTLTNFETAQRPDPLL
jgi:SWI/SNF-related matrix-associated actin-dependent regulator of chromatin subfamily A3